MSTSDILTPWYASGDVDYNARSERSFSRLRQRKTPPPIPPKAFVPPPPVVERRVITDRKVPDFGWSVNTFPKMEYAEVVAAVRMAMRGEREFVLSNGNATNLLRPWFQQCRQQGLTDVALVFSYQLDAPGLWEPSEHEAVLCWYASGRITKLTIQLADGQFRLTEKPLPVAGLRKPVCKDNLQSFRNALLDTASVATSDWWCQFFMDAVRILDSPRCSYEESKSGFYLPEPYYKYLLAVRHARLGGGMGGWYDQPGSDTRDYRLATHQLEYEKCQALLYAVNNC